MSAVFYDDNSIPEMWQMRRRPRPSVLSAHGVAVLGAVGVSLFMLALMIFLLG